MRTLILLMAALLALPAVASDTWAPLSPYVAPATPGPLPRAGISIGREDARRVPALRHKAQMQRFNAARTRQLDFAGASVAAPDPAGLLPVPIRPTVFSYQAALQHLVRVAVGDTVRFQDDSARGALTVLSEAGGCRRFEQVVSGPHGARTAHGRACLDGGSWSFGTE
ncbi:MAG: hypothetical protein VYB54_14160 [Pseudomonadota bacterium]|nr:hypothetical protein [Pseudomonadota bacterium]